MGLQMGDRTQSLSNTKTSAKNKKYLKPNNPDPEVSIFLEVEP
jgi:hypothetical protein